MDTGGLAQMTYNNNNSSSNNMSFNGGSLGVPGSGFASRGKGSHIKRLSVPHQSKPNAPDDSSRPLPSATSGPRTSRSHLLSGLRTAPKQQQQQQQQQQSTPATAPLFPRMYGGGSNQNGGGRRAPHSHQYSNNGPQTAAVGSFPSSTNGTGDYYPASGGRQMYSLPEHVLAPPPIDSAVDEHGDPIDQRLYSELVTANLYLAAQQQRLQQQLASVTAAAQQVQHLSLDQQQQILSPSIQGLQTPMGLYPQQNMPQDPEPVVQAVPGQPGVYSVYNPLTGQQNFVVDDSLQQEETAHAFATSQQQQQEQYVQSPPESAAAFHGNYKQQPQEQRRSPIHRQRTSQSPPQSATTSSASQQRQDVPAPLPTPASAGFKRNNNNSNGNNNNSNHRKNGSIAIKVPTDGVRPGGPRSAAIPPTPATGTFGPGQNRAGEHPVRQPRGPPSLEELVAKPTSKHEGSKNFATRQRRRAVHNLVRAGMERRGGQGSSSGGSVTPSSESDFNFSPTEDEHSGNRSGSVSTRPSQGSLRNAPIGSERKEKDGRSRSQDNLSSPPASVTVTSPLGEEFGIQSAGSGDLTTPTAADIVAGRNNAAQAAPDAQPGQRRRMPRFVLSSAEKRRGPN